MMRWNVLFLLLFIAFSSLYPESGQAANSSKAKVLIIPFVNKSDSGKYPSSDVLQKMIFRSLYNFIGIIPSIDVPDESALRELKWPDNSGTNTATADFSVYGDYTYTDSKANPKAVVHLKVYSSTKNQIILEKTYQTTMDIEVFDSIDAMVSDSTRSILNTKVNVSSFSFGNFKTGGGEYAIQINGKTVGLITNQDYSQNLNVLSDTPYRVVIRRTRDNIPVYDETIALKPGNSSNISYSATAKFSISDVRYKKSHKTYSVLINNAAYPVQTNINGVQAETNYSILVTDNFSNILYKDNIYLRDEETKLIFPRDKGGGPFAFVDFGFFDLGFIHFKAFLQSRPVLTLGAGVDLEPIPGFWAGIGVSGSDKFSPTTIRGTVIDSGSIRNAFAEIGFSLWKYDPFDLRVTGGWNYTENRFFTNGNPAVAAKAEVIEPFVSVEWKYFYLRTGLTITGVSEYNLKPDIYLGVRW